MSDTICIMRQGRIVQQGSPGALYDAPVSAWVADFVGKSNFLAGKVAAVDGGTAEIVAGGGPMRGRLVAGGAALAHGRRRRAGGAAGDGAADRAAGWTARGGRVLNRIFLGEHTEYLVRTDGLGDLLALVPRAAEADSGFAPGDEVALAWPEQCRPCAPRRPARHNSANQGGRRCPETAPASRSARPHSWTSSSATAAARSAAAISWASPASARRPQSWARPCPGCGARPALAAGEIGDRVALATWPNYHDPANFEAFTARDRRRRAGQRVRLERGDAGQAAGGRHRLGRVRADQLHDQHLPEAGHHRAARSGAAAQFRRRRQRGAVHGRGQRRRHGLRRAQGLGHHRLHRQHRQGDDADDQLEAVLGHDPGGAVRPGHGARLPADHDRQRAQIFRLLVQLDRSEGAGPGRGAAAQGQAASVRDHQRLPARRCATATPGPACAGPATRRSCIATCPRCST